MSTPLYTENLKAYAMYKHGSYMRLVFIDDAGSIVCNTERLTIQKVKKHRFLKECLPANVTTANYAESVQEGYLYFPSGGSFSYYADPASIPAVDITQPLLDFMRDRREHEYQIMTEQESATFAYHHAAVFSATGCSIQVKTEYREGIGKLIIKVASPIALSDVRQALYPYIRKAYIRTVSYTELARAKRIEKLKAKYGTHLDTLFGLIEQQEEAYMQTATEPLQPKYYAADGVGPIDFSDFTVFYARGLYILTFPNGSEMPVNASLADSYWPSKSAQPIPLARSEYMLTGSVFYSALADLL